MVEVVVEEGGQEVFGVCVGLLDGDERIGGLVVGWYVGCSEIDVA